MVEKNDHPLDRAAELQKRIDMLLKAHPDLTSQFASSWATEAEKACAKLYVALTQERDALVIAAANTLLPEVA